MEGFFYFICFIFGIFQIILFFKIWGMTNNVKAIKNNLKEIGNIDNLSNLELEVLIAEVRNLYFLNRQDEAYALLNGYLYKKLCKLDNAYEKEDKTLIRTWIEERDAIETLETKEYVDLCISEVEYLYKLINKEIPSSLRNATAESFKAYLPIYKK